MDTKVNMKPSNNSSTAVRTSKKLSLRKVSNTRASLDAHRKPSQQLDPRSETSSHHVLQENSQNNSIGIDRSVEVSKASAQMNLLANALEAS